LEAFLWKKRGNKSKESSDRLPAAQWRPGTNRGYPALFSFLPALRAGFLLRWLRLGAAGFFASLPWTLRRNASIRLITFAGGPAFGIGLS
jgi:hypothetical protein